MNETSSWDADRYAKSGSFVPALGLAVLDLLDPKPGERVLDLGCGDGVLTDVLAARGAAVVGVDVSPALVERAQERGLDVRLGTGEGLGFDREFDAVFSNAALHWMLDAPAVATGVARALKPGGRFVAEMGGFGNISAVLTALRATMNAHGYRDVDPGQYYPTVVQYQGVLEQAGFTGFEGELIARPTVLPTGMAAWLRTFRQGFLDLHVESVDEQAEIVDETVELLRPFMCDCEGTWYADYVRLRFSARITTP